MMGSSNERSIMEYHSGDVHVAVTGNVTQTSTSNPTNLQAAPYPFELADLVAKCRYRPGWWIKLEDIDRGQGSRGLTLIITTLTTDSYDHERTGYRVNHYFPVPPASYDRRSWQRWLFEQFLLVEQHECMEFFLIGDERPYAPSHGPGNDPYMIREYGTETDRKMKYTGEVAQ